MQADPKNTSDLDLHFAVELVLLPADLRFLGRAPPNGRPTVRPIAAPPRPEGAPRSACDGALVRLLDVLLGCVSFFVI